MFDLLVKGGTLPDGSIADIAITGDRIAASIRISIWTQPCPMVCRA